MIFCFLKNYSNVGYKANSLAVDQGSKRQHLYLITLHQ